MSKLFLTPIDLNLNELQNVKYQLLASDPGTPQEGQFWYDTALHVAKFRNNAATIILGRLDQISAPTAAVSFNGQQATNFLHELASSDPGSPSNGQTWVNSTSNLFKVRMGGVTYSFGRLDQLNAPTASLSLNNQKIVSLLDGTADTDAATVGQLNAVARGMDWKASVRAASTANVSLAAPGTTLDGVTLSANDRILLKDQTTPSENGIYVWTASGSALTRSTDADVSAEVTAGMTTWVEEGTANADTSWTLTTNQPITLGSTGLTFAKSGSAPVATGGVLRFQQTIGNGSLTSFTITHSLGTLDVIVQVYAVSSGVQVECDVTRTSTSVVTLAFTVAPTSNQYRVVILA